MLQKFTRLILATAFCLSFEACSLSQRGLSNEDQGDDVTNDAGSNEKRIVGAVCSSKAQCASGFCAQGVCCNSECAAGCVSCALEGKVGQCTPLPQKSQPRIANACPKEQPATCGFDGSCDGMGGCRQYPEGTLCGASSCMAEQETAITCNGRGSCGAMTVRNCAPYICGAEACVTECRFDDECSSGNICLARQCQVVDAPLVKLTVARPTIDGSPDDAAWNTQEWLPIMQVAQGEAVDPADVSARFKLLWTRTHLFVLVDVADDSLINASPGFRDDDAVMIGLDANNSGGQSPDGLDDVSYAFSWGEGTEFDELNLGHKQNVVFAHQNTAQGYALEARIPWQTLTDMTPVEGMRVGLQLAIFDTDGASNEAVLAWTGSEISATTVPALFGKVILGRN